MAHSLTLLSRTSLWAVAAVATLAHSPAAAQEETGWQLPDIPDFTIDGQVRHQDQRWEANDFTGQIGEIPARGGLTVDLAGEKPFVGGSLTVPDFDVEAFRAMLEETLGIDLSDRDDSEGLITSVDLPPAYLDRLSMDLELTLNEITGLAGIIESVTGQISVQEQRLAVDPLEITTPGGSITGETALNARQATPSADIVVDIETVDLAPLLEDTAAADYISGIVSGRVQLLGVGETLRAVLETADGEISLRTNEGWISGLAVEAAGLDLVEALALYIGEDERIPLDCGRIDAVVTEGVAEITHMIIANPDSILVGAGTVDLASEVLDIAIQARSKDFSLIDVDAPVLVQGTLAEPSFSLGSPDGFPLEFGSEAEPVDCTRLLEADFHRPSD